MKISVIIPAYNAAATIDETIKSVLGQTQPADEILVLDDGSTDDTFARLTAYGSRIKVFRQLNQGVAFSRNFLCRQAAGELVAFLDADDVWHPDYLKTQHEMLSVHSAAAASFTGVLDSEQLTRTAWEAVEPGPPTVEILDSVRFFESHNRRPTRFPPSACCVLKSLLDQMGDEPFPVRFRSAEDFWFMNVIPLFGRPVVCNSRLRVMYRLSHGSLSVDRLKILERAILACEGLTHRYRLEASPQLWKSLREAFPATRRKFAKYLMGVGQCSEARAQVWAAIRETRSPSSIGKSFFLLAFCCLPASLQPNWPKQFRKHHYSTALSSTPREQT